MVTAGIMAPVLLSNIGLHWRAVSVISAVLPIFGLFHIYTIPESPHWLVLNRKMRKALRALMKLRGVEYDCVYERDYLGKLFIVKKVNFNELSLTEKTYADKTSDQNDKPWRILIRRIHDPDIWKPLIVVNIMFILQIWSGRLNQSQLYCS